MAIVLTNSQHYSDIAAAIRAKLGVSTTYSPSQMPSAIAQTVDPAVFKAFAERSVTSFQVPDSWTKIGVYAFSNCVWLTSLTFGSGSQLTLVADSAFMNCGNLSSIVLPETVTKLGGYAFASSGLTSFTFPSSTTEIGASCFSHSTKLVSVSLPAALTTIGVGAFNDTRFTSITIPSGVTSIGASAFASCSLLTTITINKAENSISGAPWGASNATVIWTGGTA